MLTVVGAEFAQAGLISLGVALGLGDAAAHLSISLLGLAELGFDERGKVLLFGASLRDGLGGALDRLRDGAFLVLHLDAHLAVSLQSLLVLFATLVTAINGSSELGLEFCFSGA